jgi:anaerobic magnesium-protoporphyrin IX monomethyl ester cyclase
MSKRLPLAGVANGADATRYTAPALRGGASSREPVPPRRMRAVLVGPIQQENLALQYLAAAARRAGHDAQVCAYSYRKDLDQALRETLAAEPDLVGLGIAFQNNIEDYLAFMRALRERGYRGHLTCGGHVPTFCYRELLRDEPGLDSVVRHDGEDTLVELLDALAHGHEVANIAGLVWRVSSTARAEIAQGPLRPALADLDSLAWPERSARGYSVGGIPVEFVITARGCVGECNYCSIAAYTTEQQKRYRLRSARAAAAEIGALYQQRGARVVFVQDDLFVLPSERKTVERTAEISAALREQGARDLVFWVKGRPETVTPGVARALREMGTIHLFLGVESASAERLGYLGRTHQPAHNESAIAACRAEGIVPSFNFMLFDPDCGLDDIELTLQLAERHLDLPWNVCRTEVYSGTALRARLQSEGRLEGDYRSYGYRMADPRAEVLFRIIRVSLHERALAIESLLNRLISLSFARQLHQRFFPGAASDALAERIMALGVEARADTVRVLREGLAFVREHDVHDAARVRRFAISQALAVNAADAERRRATEELWQHLSLRGATLMAERGVRRRDGALDGWSVAASS